MGSTTPFLLILALFAIIIRPVYLENYTIESNFFLEEGCANVKGFCTLEKECPKPVDSSVKSLCKSQASDGAICCPHLTRENVNCYQLHNACTTACPESLSLGTRGCQGNETTCCVLV